MIPHGIMVRNFAAFGRKILKLRKNKDYMKIYNKFWSPVLPLRDTLVRESQKIPPFTSEEYSGEKIPPFSSQKILWWDKIRFTRSLLRKTKWSPRENILDSLKRRSKIEVSPVLPWKDTLVRKFPPSSPKDTLVRTDQKTPPFLPRRILWWD